MQINCFINAFLFAQPFCHCPTHDRRRGRSKTELKEESAEDRSHLVQIYEYPSNTLIRKSRTRGAKMISNFHARYIIIIGSKSVSTFPMFELLHDKVNKFFLAWLKICM